MPAGRPAAAATRSAKAGAWRGLQPAAAAHLSTHSSSVYSVYFLQFLEAFIQRTPQALHRLLTPARGSGARGRKTALFSGLSLWE